VWCLAASPDFGTVFSGGRDRRVFRTHLARRETQLLAQAEGPVRAMVGGLGPALSPSFIADWPGSVDV
jgi:hypothetical protein